MLRRRGAAVLEPAVGRLTGADTGRGRLPEPAEIAALAELLLHLRRRAAAGPRRPARRRQRRRHPRAARPGAVPRQRLLRQAGLRTGLGRRRARRARDARRGQHRAARPRRDARSSGWAAPLELRDGGAQGRRRGRRRGDGRSGRRLPAGARPPRTRSRRPPGCRAPIALEPNPDVLAELVAARRRVTGAGRPVRAGRVRRRDRRRHRRRPRPRPRQAGPQGLRPDGRQRRRAGQGVRPGRQRRGRSSAPTAASARSGFGPKTVLAAAVWDAVAARLAHARS